MADMLGIDRRINKQNPSYLQLKKGNIPSCNQGSEYRLRRLEGELLDRNGNKSQFNQERYKFFLKAPFEISDKCCNAMKKTPADEYSRLTGRKAILATMASESKLRTIKWLQEGCNAFDAVKPKSKPMSFWTEQDVLLYIYEYKDEILQWRTHEIEKTSNGMVYGKRIVKRQTGATICSIPRMPITEVYGDVAIDYEAMGQVEGQMDMSELASEFGIFDVGRPILKTTGVNRTGCMFCGYGCHLEKSPNRFERMKETHPKQYNYIMKPVSDGGLGYKEIIDWINEHGNMNIKY